MVFCRSLLVLLDDEESGSDVRSEIGFGCGWKKGDDGCQGVQVPAKVEGNVKGVGAGDLGFFPPQSRGFLEESSSSDWASPQD